MSSVPNLSYMGEGGDWDGPDRELGLGQSIVLCYISGDKRIVFCLVNHILTFYVSQ